MSDQVSEDLQVEILLMFGSGQYARGGMPGDADWYWSHVWEYLIARYPDMFEQRYYPDRDDHDMELLMEIHCWQKVQKIEAVRYET